MSTTITMLTPPGRGAVATVSVAGTGAIGIVAKLFTSASCKPLPALAFGSIAFGRWSSPSNGEDSSTTEELVVCPSSETYVEVHCHGGQAAVAAVMNSLQTLGAVPGEAEQWTRERDSDRIAAEARLALALVTTPRTALILLQQYHGALRDEIAAIGKLIQTDQVDTAAERLQRLIARESLGRHLSKPWNVVIAGPPNVGKSSLLNALLGYNRAIVFDQPGTTRDVVRSAAVLEGWPIQFADTAGLRATTDRIEQAGIALAENEANSADLVLWVVDATQLSPCGEGPDTLTAPGSGAITVYNKCDLVSPNTAAVDSLGVSALTGEGIERLQLAIIQRLVPQVLKPSDAVPFTSRHFSLLREAETMLASGNAAAACAKLGEL